MTPTRIKQLNEHYDETGDFETVREVLSSAEYDIDAITKSLVELSRSLKEAGVDIQFVYKVNQIREKVERL